MDASKSTFRWVKVNKSKRKRKNSFLFINLLEHPKCKLIVTHAGCNSLIEALWYGIPIVAIPLFAEQGDGAARVEKSGAGKTVLKKDISATNIYEAAFDVLNNAK